MRGGKTTRPAARSPDGRVESFGTDVEVTGYGDIAERT
ncbi:hypothetical protein HSB1_35550 [Halogranum salarium B-1]|uniref:Uncharacterized protein n=1 Tax=Halogranum salarium B-1 TaxID=1210908 RepID=J2ZYP2_9EURY|nr:hypothetical protein HSB1_35550 [Halogranum salarium B-1]